MSQEQKKQYDKPMTFVNAKRVRTGDKTSTGKDKTVLTFGLMEDFKTKLEINTLDKLIDALLPYKGKQVNLNIFIEDKEYQGRKFQSASVGVTEMIPKNQVAGAATYTTKESTADDVKAQAEKIRAEFGAKA